MEVGGERSHTRHLGRHLELLKAVEPDRNLNPPTLFPHPKPYSPNPNPNPYLQLLELVEPLCLVDEGSVRVGALVGRRLLLASLEHILNTLERDGDQARVVAREQVAERLDAPLLDEVLDLLGRAPRRGVRDRPRSLLLDVELGSRK